MSVGAKIKKLCDSQKMSVRKLSINAGVPYSTLYSAIQRDSDGIDANALQRLAAALGVSVSELLGDNAPATVQTIPPGFQPLPEMVYIPLVGSIACGTPILAEQNIEKHITVPEKWRADFVLTCHGDSMAPHIKDGDLVAIRKQPEVENGEIAAVRIDGEATLKRFYRQGDTVLLQAENSSFAPLVYTRERLNEITIEGLAVGLCRDL